MKEIIPVHKLNERSASGLEMIRFDTDWADYGGPLDAHRDDHYIFIFQEKGTTEFMLDFKVLRVQGSAVLFVLPGQVHHGIASRNASGYFLALDTSLVSDEYRIIFEQQILENSPIVIDEYTCQNLKDCAKLLYQRFENTGNPVRSVLHSLASSYVGMVAEIYLKNITLPGKQSSRAVQISGQFRNLLLQNFKETKSPAAYAALLNISLTYLNEVVKQVTGFSVSYWIHHEVIMEAKRLLFYSKLTVKEISFELGFDDDAYFSRLFTKMAGVSAGKFRVRYKQL